MGVSEGCNNIVGDRSVGLICGEFHEGAPFPASFISTTPGNPVAGLVSDYSDSQVLGARAWS